MDEGIMKWKERTSSLKVLQLFLSFFDTVEKGGKRKKQRKRLKSQVEFLAVPKI